MNLKIQAAIKNFPQDIYRFFPNLEAIYFHRTGIKYIGKEHLFGLSNLRSADFHLNNIEAIGNNLFRYQADKVEFVSFWNNPVKNVGFNAFGGMSKLRNLDFREVYCYYGDADNNLLETKRVITEIAENCLPTVEMALDIAAELTSKSQDTLKTKVRCTVDP